MRTHNSASASGIKMLLFLSLALICLVCFSKNGYSQKTGNKAKSSGVITIKDARKTKEPAEDLKHHKYHDVEVYRTSFMSGGYKVCIYNYFHDSLSSYGASWISNNDMDKAFYKWKNDTLVSIRLYNSQTNKSVHFDVWGTENRNGKGKVSGMSKPE